MQDVVFLIKETCKLEPESNGLQNLIMLRFYILSVIQLTIQLQFNNGKYFIFLIFEDIEEKIMLGDLNSKLNYSYMLICSLSHELYTPINHLINSTDYLLEICDKGSKVWDEAQLVKHISQGLLLFVHNILDFSRFINGNLRMTCDEFNLREELEGVMQLFIVKGKRKKMKVEMNCPRISIKSDKDKLMGLIFIFLDNSIKYTHRGGIKVNIKEVETKDFIRIEIIDTGIGIIEEDLTKLGAILENPLSDLRTNGAAGIGIGFRVAQVLAMYLSGGKMNLEIRSVKGQGTTVIFDVLLNSKDIEGDIHWDTFQKSFTKSQTRDEDEMNFYRERANLLKKNPRMSNYMSYNPIDNSTPKMTKTSPIVESFSQAIQHHMPLDSRTPMLISNVNQSRSRKLIIARFMITGHIQSLPMSYTKKSYKTYKTYKTNKTVESFQDKAIQRGEDSDDDQENGEDTDGIVQMTKKRAIIVDDEIFNSEYLQNHLENFGLEVSIANDGEEAISMCIKFLTFFEKVDIIFMDYSMPTMNGDLCTKNLRNKRFDPILKNTPIIGLTAHRDQAIKKQCLDAGMTIVEYKPFNRGSIKSILMKFNLLSEDYESEEIFNQEVEEHSSKSENDDAGGY